MGTHTVPEYFSSFFEREGGQRRCSKLPLNGIHRLQNFVELSRESSPHPQRFLFKIIIIIIIIVFVVLLLL
jgi:hypothetical protein